MSTPYMRTRYVLDAHSGAVSGPVRVSYFDPRTGEPCDTKPEPLGEHDQAKRSRERAGYRESLERGWKRRAVLVDGVEYESIAAAAGGDQGRQDHVWGRPAFRRDRVPGAFRGVRRTGAEARGAREQPA